MNKFSKSVCSKLKLSVLSVIAVVLASCSSPSDIAKKQTNHKQNVYYDQNRQLNRVLNSIDNNIQEYWGIEEIFYKPTEEVRYSSSYTTRTKVDYEKGLFTFETVNAHYPLALKLEIINVLLNPQAPEDGVLYDVSKVPTGTPYFINQIVDNFGRSINTYKHASEFADFLLKRSLKSRIADGRKVWYINLKLIEQHIAERAKKYKSTAGKYASKYGIDLRLVMAIMHTESAFNPQARSRSGAIGLMQIIPRNAGVDAYKFLGGSGQPSEDWLYEPENNIQAGVVYLYLMKRGLFKDIKDPLKQQYMMISSYNAGPNGTLRMFDTDRNVAIDKINRMSRQELYQFLNTQHYSLEARRYISKVTSHYKEY